LPAVLAFVCCGLLCGNRSLLAIAEWGRAHQAWCCTVFGFKQRTPCLNTLHRVLKGLDVGVFEAVLRAWIAQQVDEPEPLEPVAIDGKAVRGTKAGPHLPGAYLLSAYAGRRGLVLAQVAIGSRENELSQAVSLLRQLDPAGTVVTGDALFAQRAVCEHILARGGHYLFEVKENQALLLADVSRPFRGSSISWRASKRSIMPTAGQRSAPCTRRRGWTAGAIGRAWGRSAACSTRPSATGAGRWSSTTRSPAYDQPRPTRPSCCSSVGGTGRSRTNSITSAT
jgi:hypothetical protein